MRWFALDEWNWETQLSVPELRERLSHHAAPVRLGTFTRQKDFVGAASETGFQLTPVIWRQTSLLPQFVGTWRSTASGSQVKVIVVPNRAIHVCLVNLFACLSTLVYDSKLERVALLTISSTALGWLWLLGSYLIGASVAERKLQRLLETKPARPAEPWPGAAPRTTRFVIAIRIATVVTVIVGLVLIELIYEGSLAFTNRPAVDLVCVYWATQAIAVAWLFGLSQVSPATLVRWLTLLFGIELGVVWCAVVDGYAGDGRPLLTSRWSIERVSTFAETQVASTPSNSMPVDLTVSAHQDFSGFRGPQRDGSVIDIQLNPDWRNTAPQVVWRQPIGAGWSAFAVVAGFAVTQEQRGEDEVVVCYEVTTGRACWVHRDKALFHEMMGGDGPRATPTIHEGMVYTLGATGVLNCLRGQDGHAVWSVNVVSSNSAPTSLFGMAGSPLIWNDLVIVAPGGPGASLVAYDRRSGRRMWRAGDGAAAYASPQLATFHGVEQVLCFNAEGLFAHALTDGNIQWSISWVTPPERNNVCQPIVCVDGEGHETVFISSGYGKGAGLFEVTHDAAGFSVTPHWKNLSLQAKFASAVERDGYVYGLDNNILCCLDLRTGRRCWRGGRYGFGQLLLVGHHILVLNDEGEVVLCDATPIEHHEVARFPVLHGRTWTHPALSGDRLLIRNDRLAACVQLPLMPTHARAR